MRPKEPPKYYRQDPNYVMSPVFLSDSAYREALDSLVIVCTDAVIINRTKRTFYLAKRSVKPQQDWLIIGGRTNAGQAPFESVARCFNRETKLSVKPERFTFVSMDRYLWKERKQEPQRNGCDAFSYTFCVELSDEELQRAVASLEPKEYDATTGLQEFDGIRLREAKVHPVLIDLYHDIFQ